MSEAAWIGFVAASALASGFFFLKQRRFDLLTIAYLGAMFYFSPLFWGRVLQSSPELDGTVPWQVDLIAAGYFLALVIAGLFPSGDVLPKKAGRPLALYYLILAIAGLIGSMTSSRGAIINADKVLVLKQVGYFYVAFEIAASLACISGVLERRWWFVASGAFLLAIDLFIGFRVFVVLTALSAALVMLMRDGRIRLFTKPAWGAALVALIIAMLLVHTARFAVFDRIAVAQNARRIVLTQEMRGDILQFDKTAAAEGAWAWLQIPFSLLQRSEPSIIQATLAAIVQRDLSCKPSNIFKSLYLLLPPGVGRLFQNPFPPTFYDEYQPILYPGINYSTGGNIWAEMLCRFSYAGVATFGALLMLALIGIYRLLLRASTTTAAPIALGGVVIAFYANRNDFHYTLVMLREIAFVFAGAFVLGRFSNAFRSRLPPES
jgi:hypothetical protein